MVILLIGAVNWLSEVSIWWTSDSGKSGFEDGNCCPECFPFPVVAHTRRSFICRKNWSEIKFYKGHLRRREETNTKYKSGLSLPYAPVCCIRADVDNGKMKFYHVCMKQSYARSNDLKILCRLFAMFSQGIKQFNLAGSRGWYMTGK